jgi:hypothetical protein
MPIRKGSLLTRIMGGKDSDESDDDSAENLKRTEGLDAPVFSASLGTGVAPVPPKYIRVHCPTPLHDSFLIYRCGRTTRSEKTLTIYSSRKNFTAPPTSAIRNIIPR